jgi:hypothetical protein
LSESTYDSMPLEGVPPPGVLSFTCHLCSVSTLTFATSKVLASHQRAAHGVRNMYRKYVDHSGVCPVCHTMLYTRLRVIAHLSDKRRNLNCRAAILEGRVKELSSDAVSRLDALDTAQRREAQRAGKSHPVAVRCAVRASGKKCGRPAAH